MKIVYSVMSVFFKPLSCLARLVRVHRHSSAVSRRPPPSPNLCTFYLLVIVILLMPAGGVGLAGEAFTNSFGMKFRLIPAGKFLRGSSSSEKHRDENEPQHQVTISKAFYLCVTEVTQAQWKAVMGSNPSRFKGDNLPVENVSWNDAQEFVKKLSKKGGKTYRLPTEAEWEYACRAETSTPFHFGSSLSSEQANFDGNFPYGGAPEGTFRKKTVAVSGFKPNAWGLYDMHGNVWEWCEDWFGGYPTESVTDPMGAPKKFRYRVVRGGAWDYDGKSCRSAYRASFHAGYRDSSMGLRVAMSP